MSGPGKCRSTGELLVTQREETIGARRCGRSQGGPAARRGFGRQSVSGWLGGWLAGLALALLVAGCGGSGKPQFVSTDITGAEFGRELALTDHNGSPRRLADFRGKAVAVFFGYTQCPDVCPTAMTTFADVMKRLGPRADRLQVLFVTVDPERDTPALLAQYVPQFHPSFLGLHGDPARTAEVAKEYRVFYQKQAGATPASYTIDHTAGAYLYDPQGRIRLYVRHGETAERIAADVELLLKGA